ncbi:MAG: hypothetical protein LBI06_07735 [Treponema sp.]|nr:hypothetical protein [Treponema sp.]
MKKLIAISVVFALAVGGVFAADIGATVFGGVRVIEASSAEDTEVGYSAGMSRIRIEGSGQNGDGTFGAWIRFDPTGGTYAVSDGNGGPEDNVAGLAWWKPIDQVKLTLGGNPDGLYGKEGYAGWMFYQMPSDIGIVDPASVWGGGYLNPGYWLYGSVGINAKYRNAFYGGFDGNGLMLDIKPVPIFGLNIILPYFNDYKNPDPDPKKNGQTYVAGVFKRMTIQADVNLDVGNIAFTFDMAPWTKEADKPDGALGGTMYLYFGLTAVDNLSLDVGVGFPLPQNKDNYKHQDPIAAGLAAKYDVNDAFGLKARLLAQFAGSTKVGDADPVKDPFVLGVDLLPYYAINDSVKAFLGLGLVMASFSGDDAPDAVVGFHINPYIQVGAEWGPTFYAGIRVYSYGDKQSEKSAFGYYGKDVSAPIHFEIPIGLQVSF